VRSVCVESEAWLALLRREEAASVSSSFHVFGAELFYKLGRVSRLLQQYSRYRRPRMRRDRTRKYE
jgi:hypothetical protein